MGREGLAIRDKVVARLTGTCTPADASKPLALQLTEIAEIKADRFRADVMLLTNSTRQHRCAAGGAARSRRISRVARCSSSSRFRQQPQLCLMPVSPQLTALLTSAPILASASAVNSVSAKAIGHMVPSSSFA